MADRRSPRKTEPAFGGWRPGKQLARSSRTRVRRVEHVDGRRGAIKERLEDGKGVLQRFGYEVAGMRRMTEAGIEGVLPVLDADAHENPKWFVMPEATPLAQTLGTDPTLWQVVTAIEQVAATLLVVKSELGVAHRDIKPANLFFLDGRAAVGDFGIGTWAPREADLTRTGSAVGPAHFLAPEMRTITHGEDPHLADVWALAKTLFALVYPRRGTYPPPGTHYVQGQEFELWTAGKQAGEALGPVLEAATRYRAQDRMSLEEFHAELNAWLANNPNEPTPAPSSPSSKNSFVRFASVRLSRRAENALVEEAARRLLYSGARACAELLNGDRDAWIGNPARSAEVPELLVPDKYFPRASEDEFAIDSYDAVATEVAHDGLRAVIALGSDSDRSYLVIEVHASSTDEDRLLWGQHQLVKPRMPSAQQSLDDLVAGLREYLNAAGLRPVPSEHEST
jgi:serine/threonine protein kinase